MVEGKRCGATVAVEAWQTIMVHSGSKQTDDKVTKNRGNGGIILAKKILLASIDDYHKKFGARQ